MKDVRSPEDMAPLIVKLAPYITTTITESVDAALRPPEKRPTTFCITKQIRLNVISNKSKHKHIDQNIND